MGYTLVQLPQQPSTPQGAELANEQRKALARAEGRLRSQQHPHPSTKPFKASNEAAPGRYTLVSMPQPNAQSGGNFFDQFDAPVSTDGKTDFGSGTITARSADGMLHKFPAGTSQDVIDRVMKDYAAKGSQQTWEITAPDGKRYNVTGNDQAGAVAALKKHLGAQPTTGEARGYGFADAVGLGFADEVGSGIGAVVGKLSGDERPISDIYSEFLNRGRARDEAAYNAHPADYIGGEVGGTVLTLPIGGTAVKGARSLWELVRAGAKAGAAYGGLHGFGSGEGGVVPRLQQAGTEAAIGAGLGASIPAAGKGVGSVVKSVGYTPFQSATKYAGRKVAQAADRAGMTLQDAVQEVNRLQKTNPEVMLADVLGKSGHRLTRAVVNKGGSGAEDLTQTVFARQAGQGDRITGTISKSLGDPASYHQSLDDALTNLKTNAKPIYERAYQTPINYATHGAALDNVFARIPKRLQAQVVQNAQDLMQAEGVQSQQIFARIAPDGSVTFERLPDIRQWDYIKRGIDAVIEGQDGKAASGGLSQLGRSLNGIKTDLLNVLDTAAPDYAKARKVYSDDLTVKKALEQGRESLNADPELIVRTLKGMDTAARDMFRVGYARAMNDVVDRANIGHNVIDRIWAAPGRQKRLAAVFGDKAKFREFADFARGEQQMASTKHAVTGNSTTSQQINDLLDAGNPAADFALNAARGGWKSAVANWVMTQSRTLGGLTEARANAIADLLLADGATPTLLKAGKGYALSKRTQSILRRLGMGITRSGTIASTAEMRLGAN